MRRFRLRLLWRVNCEGLMRAAGQNLKRLLKKRGWGRRPCPAEAVFALFLAVCGWLTHKTLNLKLFACLSTQMMYEQGKIHFSFLTSFDGDFFNRLIKCATCFWRS